ncbi:hypothetical protein DL079_19525 [Salmonella enterica subsp. enterica serovar Kokomlemle]|nr:hypothetical protein [Salmonella enterica subsp. enterica serovar Kokomlemle]
MISFTQEELQRIADTDHVQCGDASAIARMLLASLNSTPIYQVQYGQQWRDVTKERYEDHRDHGSPTRIVYATPQPVQDSEAQAAPTPINMSDDDIRALAEKHHAVIVCNGTGDYNDNYESVVKFGRALIAVLRPVPKFRVEETYHNILKEEQEVNARLAEYSLNKSQPQPTPESEDRKMLKRLAVIMSGSDSGGEISALKVTAQSLVDRCKALACGKEKLAATESLALGVKCPFPYGWEELKRRTNQDTLFFSAYMVEGEEVTDLHRDIVDRMVDRLLKVIAACQTDASYSGPTTWNPASLEEVNKRSVREHEQQHTSTFPPAKGPQIPPIPPSQAVHIALYSPKLPVEVLAAVKEVVRIRLDFNDFDGDRRGIGECLERAEQKLIEIINKNAALLDKEIA